MSKSNRHQLNPEAYTQLRGRSPALCAFLVKELEIGKDDHVLDIGCGPGENTVFLAGLSKARVEGLDLDEGRIAFARSSNSVLLFHIGNAEALVFNNESFSVVTMMLAIQRFEDRATAINESLRILCKGGRLGIVTVAPEQLAARPDFSVFPTALRLECERFPNIEDLASELCCHGFVDIRVTTFQEVIRPLDSAYLRWLEERPFTVLRCIPDIEFRAGLSAIEESIKNAQSVQLVCDEYTIISARKA